MRSSRKPKTRSARLLDCLPRNAGKRLKKLTGGGLPDGMKIEIRKRRGKIIFDMYDADEPAT
jgi:hypothetical protein